MAQTKKSSSSSKKTTQSSSSNRSSVWSLNKISFYTIVAVAFLYAIAMVLSVLGVSLKVVGALQGIASAIMVIIVAILAWRFVSRKPAVWKVLYIICLLLVIVCIIVPLVK